MIENPAGEPVPTSEDLISTAFERLSTAKKVMVFEDIVYALGADLSRFYDPVLTQNLDVLDSICCNIEQRIEEMKAVYGLE